MVKAWPVASAISRAGPPACTVAGAPATTWSRMVLECTRSRTVTIAPITAVPNVPASVRTMLNSVPPARASLGCSALVLTMSSGTMMNGSELAWRKSGPRKSPRIQSLVR